MTILLEVQDLRLHYHGKQGTVRAVDGVSLALEEGQALGVVGESGAGKSSLALVLLRLLPRNVAHLSGRVLLGGRDLLAMDEGAFRRQVRWREVSMVFQGAMEALNPVLRVGYQVAEPLLEAGEEKAAARRRVRELLEMVGLSPEVETRYPHELSGGMKQRVVIAMALAFSPRLVILDEPTSALDVSVQAQVLNLLKRLKRELGLTFLFITHDIALACDLCDSLAVMYAGEVVEQGGIEGVVATPAHPYTRMLLASIPRLEDDAPPLPIPGAPPDPAAPPSGCRFHPRCPRAFTRCDREVPPALAAGPGHAARCWLLQRETPP
jgi:oligopeptide/dipeptide ABC transporter ATP-binding protein